MQFKPGDKCRIKTEKEFINQYGNDWMFKVHWNTDGLMNYLFGKDFTIQSFNPYSIYGNAYKSYEGVENNRQNWRIFKNMLSFKE